MAKPGQEVDTKCYRYILLKGNNHPIISRVMDSRVWWQKIPHTITLFDFKWTPYSSQIKYDFLGKHGEKNLVNHFEHHACLSQKDQLANNLVKAAETMQRNCFEFLPITFVIDNSEKLLFETAFDKFTIYFNTIEKNKNNQLKDINNAL